jgi:L-threonylcarbamoyladenylate synthase
VALRERPELLAPGAAGVSRAAELLAGGQVVAFPTDTVYGLAALAGDHVAVRRVYEIKGRPAGKPLIVMVAWAELAAEVAEVGDPARGRMERFWPGPLTLVLRARPGLPGPLVAGDPPTVGVRVPDHPLALALLAAVGSPLATTSANLSGDPPALNATEAAALAGVAAVLDGGPAGDGLASTILDLSGETPRVLRQGPVPADHLLG